MSREHKLYRDGRFFDLVSDPFEERPLSLDESSGDDMEAAKLQKALDQYADVRPAALLQAPDRRRRRGR